MSVVCEMAAPFVANSAVEDHPVIWPFRSHTSICLKCQARHAAMSRLARELTSLKGERYTAPADLEWRVMSSLEGDLAVARTWRKPLTWSAAVVSMAVALLLWRLRPKPS